jgi:FkbM family methyltransferase
MDETIMTNILKNLLKLEKPSLNNQDPFVAQKSLLAGQEDLLIFDVGAYIGDITDRYAKTFPNSTIFCFEPFPDSFEKLNTRANTNIKPFQIAISDENSSIKLNINTDKSCNSIFDRPEVGPKYYSDSSVNVAQIEVETKALDSFCSDENIGNIDILKLDAEGAELKILNGASEMLRHEKIKLIYSEVMFVAHYQGGVPFL